MELNEVFNAGRGSVLNADGEVEMDASVMVGSDLSAGAVTVVKNIEHPISLARLVMEKTDHVLLAGDGAERFAREQGVPLLPSGCLVTDRRKRNWEKEKLEIAGETVGALAIDESGRLAAATSTGGRARKLVGRSSDTCMIGSGTYADDNVGAVSTTGHGETVAKFCLAHAIIRDMEYGKTAQKATTDCVQRMTERLHNTAGAITLSKDGDVGIGFSTEHMSWAYIKDNELHYGATLNDDNVDPL
ncbi:isoaspartyl peptidase/L-asparaginase-like [Photinus pyralis]|uniref:isoaspartyl peptidase/L-asparaginase-like n=1 Tax=Photinus pyralis TaxID=7054 RepID=UPI001267539C|nr:isoaspartyl peptidase/L-asparaginase-like [Photinus pyralis]